MGEVALVSWKSPIRESGVAFHNGLFDENMACHFAFGAGFPTAIHAADPEKAGVNQSKTHFDFMVGTEDLSVTGVTKDGKEVPIMKDGVFVIRSGAPAKEPQCVAASENASPLGCTSANSMVPGGVCRAAWVPARVLADKADWKRKPCSVKEKAPCSPAAGGF